MMEWKGWCESRLECSRTPLLDVSTQKRTRPSGRARADASARTYVPRRSPSPHGALWPASWRCPMSRVEPADLPPDVIARALDGESAAFNLFHRRYDPTVRWAVGLRIYRWPEL